MTKTYEVVRTYDAARGRVMYNGFSSTKYVDN